MAKFPPAPLWRCALIGRSGGLTLQKWKTKMQTAWRIILVGASPR